MERSGHVGSLYLSPNQPAATVPLSGNDGIDAPLCACSAGCPCLRVLRRFRSLPAPPATPSTSQHTHHRECRIAYVSTSKYTVVRATFPRVPGVPFPKATSSQRRSAQYLPQTAGHDRRVRRPETRTTQSLRQAPLVNLKLLPACAPPLDRPPAAGRCGRFILPVDGLNPAR